MITEDKLDELSHEEFMSGGDSVQKELIRLARLGLWARKVGIPIVKQGLRMAVSDFCSHIDGNMVCGYCEPFGNALKALPKDGAK